MVKQRAYRSVGSDMKNLLDSMQSQLKFVTLNLDIVRKMCNVQTQKDRVAFSARLGKAFTSSVNSVKVVFDKVLTNIGGAYNPTTGVFRAPSDGVYVFAWTVMTNPRHLFDTELVVNGNIKYYNAADSAGGGSYESSGCTGVLQLNKGDQVWIRKYQKYGNLLREDWSSFSGWQLE